MKKFMLHGFLAMLMASMISGCGSSTAGEGKDTTAPVIKILGNNPDEVALGSKEYKDPGATAVDEVDGKVSVTATGKVDTSKLGAYTITYVAKDSSGNESSANRTVNVVDLTPPVITVNGKDETIEAGSTYTPPSATATDNVDSTVKVTMNGEVDTLVPETYTLTYSAVDSAGNKATETITVKVVDTTPPVITVNGKDETIKVGSDYTEPTATAIDIVDGKVAVTMTGSVDTTVPGTYTLTYSAEDKAGNKATPQTIIVTVESTGGTKEYKVVITTADQLAGYEIKLKFTKDFPAKADVVLDNAPLEVTGRTMNDLGPNFNETEKTIYFGAWSMGSEVGASGSFEVLTFKTSDKVSEISIVKDEFTDKDASNIAASVAIEGK